MSVLPLQPEEKWDPISPNARKEPYPQAGLFLNASGKLLGFPSGVVVKNPPAVREMEEAGSVPGQEDPWRGAWQPAAAVLPGNPKDRGAGGLQSTGSHRVGQEDATWQVCLHCQIPMVDGWRSLSHCVCFKSRVRARLLWDAASRRVSALTRQLVSVVLWASVSPHDCIWGRYLRSHL